MSLQVEKLEKNMANLTITVSAEDFNKAITKSFNKNKSRFNIPGFRKGKATQAMVEKYYGLGALLEDAVDIAIDQSYPTAVKESELEIVSRPEIDIKEVGKDKDFVYVAKVAVRPEVTLGEYKGVEVKKADATVTEEDIAQELSVQQEKNARLISVDDRAVEDKDQLLIDFDGSVDGVHFDGGKAEDYPLTIGSKNFIAGFEDQIIGHKLGEEFDVNVTFPENYHAKELAGKPAVFKVKIKEIKRKELPELNDEFASEISEFDTLDAYKESIKESLSVKKQKKAANENEHAVVQKVVENATMDIPDPMIELQIDKMLQDYASRMQSQGISLDQYMQFTGMTVEKLRDQMREQAINNIKTRLVLEDIVKAEKIEVDEARMEEEFAKMASQYDMEVEKIREHFANSDSDILKNDIAVQEAIDMLVAEAKLV